MPEQIIAAELHRDAGGQIWAIKFDGVVYVPARRMPVPPPNPLLAGYVGDSESDEIPSAFQDINRQRPHIGVLHDRPETSVPPMPKQTDPHGVYQRMWDWLPRRSKEQ